MKYKMIYNIIPWTKNDLMPNKIIYVRERQKVFIYKNEIK